MLALLIVAASLAIVPSDTNATARTFFSPSLDGQRIAFCLQSSDECGKPVADAWCRSQGHDEALLFQRDTTSSGEALYADTGQPCAGEVCVSFRQIKCRTA